MATMLRKIMPIGSPSNNGSARRGDGNDDDENDGDNYEYSFALEYSGPVGDNIPRVLPIVVGQIPVASPVASMSSFSDSSVRVIQPIVKSTPSGKSRLNEPTLRSKYPNGAYLSGESSSRVDHSDAVGLAASSNGKLELYSGEESSSKLESLGHQDNLSESLDCTARDDRMSISSELVGSSSKLESSHDNQDVPDDNQEGADTGFCNYMNPANSESSQSGLSSRSLSSEVFSGKEGDDNNGEVPHHVKKPSMVTFLEPGTSGTTNEESVFSDAESNDERPKAERTGKKGSCYRCSRGNRFTEKETCIVCGAKFCCNCVLRAMGSMPEGRKCVTCIGFRIDEARRGSLGKSSRLLKKLLTDIEIRQIMKSEISCAANQLPPQHVFVNGEPLSQKQLVILQGCPNPPKNLTPGSYWYDKVSGLWGKEGHKPCQIITHGVDVGGTLMPNASNGKTNVCINNRQITKSELKVLKAAGERCEGNLNFWLYPDGSYIEEGQRHEKGKIWEKKRVRLLCALLSLPTPGSVKLTDDDSNPADLNYPELPRKLLLVGDTKSGTSTIYKQAKLVFEVPFTEDERGVIKLIIQSNLYRYIAVLLEGRERFEEESLTEKGKRVVDPSSSSAQSDPTTVYTIGARLKAFSDWLLKVMMSGNLEAIFPAATREYAPFVEELLKDSAFQATYNRRNELEMLPRIATYFMERAVEISRPGYEPSDMDILYAEGITSTNGLSAMEFSFPKSTEESFANSSDLNDSLFRYQLIRVHPKNLGENCKWLEMFEDVDIVLFSVSLDEYDMFSEDINGDLTNKMMMSKQLFQSLVTHPKFNDKHFLLLLNKYDLLEEKIEQVPLTKCEWFQDFHPVISHNHNRSNRRKDKTSLAQYAFHYIALKFKTLFRSLSARKKLFVSQVTGLEPDSVREALSYAKEILKWEEEEGNWTHPDISSFTDMEQTTSS